MAGEPVTFAEKGRVRVLCLGNEIRGDDGVGVRVGRVLRSLPLPDHIEVAFLPGVGLDLLDGLRGCSELILVDAVQTGGPPGQLRVTPLAALATDPEIPPQSHGLNVVHLLALLDRLAGEPVPARVTLVGVQAARTDHFSTRLSPAVGRALPRAVAEVLRLAGAPPAVVAVGLAAAERLAAWEPDPGDNPG